MLVECVAIVLVILLMAFSFLRAKRKDYAFTTLPLLVLPLMHIFSMLLAKPLHGMFSLDAGGIIVAIDATALVASCIILGAVSHRISSKKARSVYLTICGIFVVVLTWVLIANTIGGAVS